MAEESFMLVSLKENKAKKLAEVIGNDTCRKILDFLSSKKSATETEISKVLGIPISTVHYNLKHLLENKLVKADEYHYSEKGKEVNHYSLTNKLIIIAPSREGKFMDKLKSILPISLMAVAGAGIIHFISRFKGGTFAAMDIQRAASEKMLAAAPAAMGEAADAAIATTTTIKTVLVPVVQQSSLALWFLFGAAFTIVFFLLIEWLRKR